MMQPGRKVRLVLIESLNFDYASIFEKAFTDINLDFEILRIPFFPVEALTTGKLNEIRAVARASSDDFLIFCPGTMEVFLPEADLHLGFSAYRRWYDKDRMKILPHPWTIVSPSGDFKWKERPPLMVGFMGTSYSNSRMLKLLSKLPASLQNLSLQGWHLQNPEWIARLNRCRLPVKYMNAFARTNTLRVLSRGRRLSCSQIEIVPLTGFGGTKVEKDRYLDHIGRMTYVLCPRGIENFSIRAYEALKFGRIPVVIDTDMVHPDGISWKDLALIVPYRSLRNVEDIILGDYHSHTTRQLVERQEAALSAMDKLDSMTWLNDVIKTSLQQR